MFTRYCLGVASASYTTGIFTVPLEAARSIVPDDYFTVAEILPGEAMFFVGTGEFRVADLGPYMELYVGFYTESRLLPGPRTQEENLAEFSANLSKMYMWKNWVTTDAAHDKMIEVGSSVFRRGAIERIDHAHHTTFEMSHESDGRIRFTAPRDSAQTQSDFKMTRTHYGRLNGVPSRVDLDLDIDRMVTSLAEGELEMEGAIAEACKPLGIPKAPIVSIWIEEMSFKMTRPIQLPGGTEAAS